MSTGIRASCPACGNTNGVRLGESASGFSSAQGDRVFVHPPYAVARCPDCDLLYKLNTPPALELAEYYSRLGFQPFDNEVPLPPDEAILEVLRNVPRGGKVLDFGCSTGRLLRALSHDYSCFGVEPNLAAAEIASQRGVRILAQSELAGHADSGFDVVILTDVYEHLVEPVREISMLASLLRPGAMLILVTGMADAIPGHHRIAEYWYFRLFGHLQMATERHLTWLAGRVQITLERLIRCSHYATPLPSRLHQWTRSLAYHGFRNSPRGMTSATMRMLPIVRRAEHWDCAPALTCVADHAVAIFRNPLKDVE